MGMIKNQLDMLIYQMKQSGVLKDKRIEIALRKIKREKFIPKEAEHEAYRDYPVNIGFGQTISQPSTVVKMTEALSLEEGQKVLEVGCGSGWQSALIANIIGQKGKVFAIERIQKLIEFAKANLRKAKIKNIKIKEGDGSLGWRTHAPYDRIILTCAAPEVPKPLLEQLKINGILVIPVGTYMQEVHAYKKKSKTEFEKRSLGYFAFVPLIGKFGFKG